MKNQFWVLAIILMVTTGCIGAWPSVQMGYPRTAVIEQEYRMDSGMDYIYDYLAPYGDWVELHPYGYVWTPRYTGYRWRPYSDGHWLYTEDGWTWMANEEWGSIPFHYGRWGYDNDFGWFWVPGTEWSPAWVSWRWSDQYTGWAPLPPEVEFRRGVDYSSRSFNIPNHFWVFLQTPRFLDNDLYRYALPPERNLTIINITIAQNRFHNRNDRIINDGIGIDALRRIIRRDIPRYQIRDIDQHRRAKQVGNDVQIFRPTLKLRGGSKPSTVLNRNQAKQDLPAARVFEPRKQTPIIQQQKSVRLRQSNEKILLKKTQSQDLKQLQLRYHADLLKAGDKRKKVKIKQDQKVQTKQLLKRHLTEKKELDKRHKKDVDQVKKVVKRKKK